MQSEENQRIISSALLKVLVGGLLVYYAYILCGDVRGSEQTKQIVLVVFAILFVLVGIIFAILGILTILKLFRETKILGEQTEEKCEESQSTSWKNCKETHEKNNTESKND